MMVSVILPVYNVENYIRLCLESLLCQTYKQFELIIVDDCSLDRSIEIAHQLLDNETLFPVKWLKHRENCGLSAARNTGIKIAKGDFVLFVDSDDELDPQCLEKLLNEMCSSPDIEMVIGRFDEFKVEKKYFHTIVNQLSGSYSNDVIGAYIEGKLPTTAWNKLIKRSFLNDNHLFFEEGLVHEDALWSFLSFCCAKKIVVSNRVTYHYLQRPGSLDKQDNKKLHLSHYNKVFCLQAQYVFNHQLQEDKRLLYFIEKQRYQLLTDASMIDSDFGYSLYQETRNYPYWFQWNRILPQWLGFAVYIKVRCCYLKCKQIVMN